jgi:phospholipase/carboxylesterase
MGDFRGQCSESRSRSAADRQEDGMDDEDPAALLPSLLRALDALAFVARYLNPLDFADLMRAVGAPDQELRAARQRLTDQSDGSADMRSRLAAASVGALAAFSGLRAAADQEQPLLAVYQALRHAPRAHEALYPLAATLPAVSRFFLDPAMRDDVDLQARASQPARPGETGVIHVDNDPGTRGGFSLYVPEYYSHDAAWPLVVALHGGSGNGRAFLWSWLRDARSHGAILMSPTATGRTWALMGDDTDTPNLARILDGVRQRWRIDPARILLTGMSDGGTFALVSGLQHGSPFTHLAPVASAFHPLLIEMADADRVRGLPIYLVHGALDWMFPVRLARSAHQALSRAGARVTYREIDDLSHCYPREENAGILAWLRGA